MNDTDELPNEIFINMFLVETEEKESRLYNEQSTENQELRKVTSWLTEDEHHLVVILFKHINESYEMESIVQRKLLQNNFM